MWVDYTDLYQACPKDSYPLSNINKLVENLVGYKFLLFMDAYSNYNQIPMYEVDKEKNSFMIMG